MININSTEEERYNDLKNRKLKVYMWDSTKAMQITDPEESIAKVLKKYALSLNLIGSVVTLEGIVEPVNINMPTIKESISSMTKQHANLLNLAKLFTIFNKVAENAILIEVEPFRHHQTKPQKAKEILDISQYISAFCDDNMLYPVKISAERRRNNKKTNIHVTITVGSVSLNEIKKEEFSILRMHSSSFDEESVDSGRTSSFYIILSNLVKYFNENEAIIIKNLPDLLLSKEQRQIKSKLIQFDKNKDIIKCMERYRSILAEAAERGDILVYKTVPHEYSEQMRNAMYQSGICFVPLTTENGYLNIVVQKKDTDAFLQVQTSVFQNETKPKYQTVNENHNFISEQDFEFKNQILLQQKEEHIIDQDIER